MLAPEQRVLQQNLRFPDYRCSPSPAFNSEKFTNAPERGSQFESPLLHQLVGEPRRFGGKRPMDLQMTWPDQWSALGLIEDDEATLPIPIPSTAPQTPSGLQQAGFRAPLISIGALSIQ